MIFIFTILSIFNIFSSSFFLSWACYPILGALLVPISVVCYEHLYKYKITNPKKMPIDEEPSITILIPAHNEQAMLSRTASYLATKLNYHNYEIIICDDGSQDKTPQIADNLTMKYKKVRVVHMTQNGGKAHAYNVALGFAKGDFIYSNDADTLPEPDCLWKYMNYFMGFSHRNVGAVTGNMDIINRSKSICKAQISEFTSIIGGIKRSQSAYAGTQYAFSGACLMVRKDALIDVGGFSQSLDTEDIDLAWRMSRNGWESLFAPDIFSYMAVPDTARKLIKQRKRWASGGSEVWMRSFFTIIRHPWIMRQKLPIYVDASTSNTWSFLYWILLCVFIYDACYYFINQEWTNWYYLWIFMMCIVCFEYVLGSIQMLVALHYDDKGRKHKYFFFCQMYLAFTWMVNPLTVVITMPKAIKVDLGFGGSNAWTSPR